MGACRTKVAGQFREGSGLTMFTSDVSARGVDYPDVSLVLQVPTCWLNRLLLLWDAQFWCCPPVVCIGTLSFLKRCLVMVP